MLALALRKWFFIFMLPSMNNYFRKFSFFVVSLSWRWCVSYTHNVPQREKVMTWQDNGFGKLSRRNEKCVYATQQVCSASVQPICFFFSLLLPFFVRRVEIIFLSNCEWKTLLHSNFRHRQKWSINFNQIHDKPTSSVPFAYFFFSRRNRDLWCEVIRIRGKWFHNFAAGRWSDKHQPEWMGCIKTSLYTINQLILHLIGGYHFYQFNCGWPFMTPLNLLTQCIYIIACGFISFTFFVV